MFCLFGAETPHGMLRFSSSTTATSFFLCPHSATTLLTYSVCGFSGWHHLSSYPHHWCLTSVVTAYYSRTQPIHWQTQLVDCRPLHVSTTFCPVIKEHTSRKTSVACRTTDQICQKSLNVSKEFNTFWHVIKLNKVKFISTLVQIQCSLLSNLHLENDSCDCSKILNEITYWFLEGDVLQI